MTVYGPDGRPYQHEIPGSPPDPVQTDVRIFIGLDIGQRQDYTALAYIERHQRGSEPATYRVRRLKRWIGESYSGVIVPELVDRLPAWGLTIDDVLVVDETGVGTAVVDMFCMARLPTVFAP